ncbi:PadR family transcriptional regulator [Bacillus sp. NP157]|nr:PadR family transcriptional regulator [Bacillus sp. NP157]
MHFFHHARRHFRDHLHAHHGRHDARHLDELFGDDTRAQAEFGRGRCGERDHGQHGHHGGHHGHHGDHHHGRWTMFGIGRGGGRFSGGGPFGFDDREGGRGGRGGGRFGGGRMFGTGDLRLLLLALIEEQPRHGYELIRTIEEMFNGQYSPSPGAIYPTLTMLEELGYARVEAETGGKKLYAITDEGRAFLTENRDTLDALTERLQVMSRHMRRMTVPDGVRDAMHVLKHQLMNHHKAWDEAETLRVAAIVAAAAKQIAERQA